MAMEMPSINEKELLSKRHAGSLAIDLGATTTVVAFQGEFDKATTLLEFPAISRTKGEIPSLVWHREDIQPSYLFGQEVLSSDLAKNNKDYICNDFKRWIGSPDSPKPNKSNLSPEKAGELLINEIWQRLPSHFLIKRLVLTAPVDTYRAYRTWLIKACSKLPVDEVALVDEPTAAAMGAGIPAGSKLLVVDIGGSTIDLSLVALEGGEGKAEPIAQLLRFNGQELEGKSNQILRCAKVLSKAGLRLGGRDIDRWIANHLFPKVPLTEEILNAAESLKCRLSQKGLTELEPLLEKRAETNKNELATLEMNRLELEKLLIDRGLLKSLQKLLEQTIAKGETNGCSIKDLEGVVLVGGGAKIPLLRNWLKKKIHPTPFLTPPPIEAVSIGALRLTPGVTIKDVLHRGVSLRCWDQRSKRHSWHPLFLEGQTWPTQRPLEIILAASKINQIEIELVIGEPDNKQTHEVIYVNGIPTIREKDNQPSITPWAERSISIELNPPGKPGEDCIKLKFSIDEKCQLKMQGFDLRSKKEIREIILGSVR